MSLLKEITQDYSEQPLDLMEAISSAVKELKLIKKGGKITNAKIRSFIKKNPTLTQAATINALAAYNQYKTNKRNTVSLFAKSPYDKRMIKRMVDTMTKSGMFKLHRSRYADGGKYYELKQVKIGY